MIEVGTILAGYRIDGVVGRGATAIVYAATELAGVRRVALKVLAPHLRAHGAVRDRFRQAALLQQSLRHPNILDVHDVVEADDEVFLVLPLVGDGTLGELISAGTLTAERALPILRQVADALDFAHGADVVHGDVKPRNVLLDESDVAYLGDFGLAVAVTQVASAAAASPGTIAYSAPERLRGEPPTPSADVYALACVLFQCLTGVVPYSHDKPAAVVGGHLFNAPPTPSELSPHVPAELDEILARALAKDPAERPRSAGELVDAAEDVLEQVGTIVFPSPPPRDEESAAQPSDDTLGDPVPVLVAPPVIETDEAPTISRRAVAVAALLLVAIAVVGAWLGQRGADADGRSLEHGSLALMVPAEWSTASAPAVAGLTLTSPLALADEQSQRATLVVGTARAAPPTFLPQSLLERIPRPRPPALVELEGGVGYRYTRLAPNGLQRLRTLYVLPGPERSAVAACIGPRLPAGSLRDCESVARSLRVRRGAVYDATPSQEFAAAHNAAMRVLRVARDSGLESLRTAELPRTQARAAIGVAVAYRTTSASMLRTRPPPIARAARDRLVRALNRAGVGYTRLAGSSRRHDAQAYAAARSLILEAEEGIRDARRDLLSLGYAG